MLLGRIAAGGWLALLVIGAGCGSSPQATGTAKDAGAADMPADAPSADQQPSDLPRFETNLPPSLCGNGRLDPGEECDDGNLHSGDGCSGLCQVECPASNPGCRAPGTPGLACGDGILVAGEACDDGNASSGDGCAANCAAIEAGWTCPVPGHRCIPVCGDGVITGPETCDDGNQQSGDGCSSTCVTEGACFGLDGAPVPCAATCGNGRIDGSEECDDGPQNADVSGACSTDCRHLYFCGDGIVTPPETCDLGGNNAPLAYDYTSAPGDGCSAVCTKPRYCGDGIVDVTFGEQCDLGSGNGQPRDVGGTTCVVCGTDCLISIDCN